MEMCRFSGLNDKEYLKVSAALTRVLAATTGSAPTAVPSVPSRKERREYLDSLKFTGIEARHATIKAAHAKTCKWLLGTFEYQGWQGPTVSEHGGFLWIKGKPGTGKSTIMKFAYANAKKKMKDTVMLSFFFNARGGHLEKAMEGMYRSLLWQLLDQLPELQVIFDSWEGDKPVRGDDCPWDIESLQSLFSSAIKKIGQRQLTCFIDALDECKENQVREMVSFFEQLSVPADSSQARFRVCFSSRHYPHITINNSVALILEGHEGHKQDITNYLDSELKAGNGDRLNKIKMEVLDRASGIFLWVVLVVQMLNKEFDRGRIHALRKRLDEIPDGLEKLFADILRDGENTSDTILCLQWLLYAKRPLKREELYFAILAGVGVDVGTPWSAEEITHSDMERFIINSSRGLAEVTKSKDQTVQFIHESVRDYLLKDHVLDALVTRQPGPADVYLDSGHERLKQCCQRYMSIDLSGHVSFATPQPKANSEEAADRRQSASKDFPFLEYAVRHVLHHADAAAGDGVSQLEFVENFPLRKWITLDNLFEKYQIRRHTSDASLLYILAEENLPSLIRIELKRVPHMDIRGERYGFPVVAALANKNKSAVQVLLMPYKDAQSDSDMLHGQPLCVTAEDCEHAIECLLRNGREISSLKGVTKLYPTLLAWAVHKGHEAVVRLLLATGKVDPDSKNSAGKTLLSQAAADGHEAVARLLLATGKVDPDSKDSARYTPLSQAANRGHEAVVRLLLATGKVDPDSKNSAGKTLLSQAAADGHEAVVRLLLATGKVDPDSKDSARYTPLSQAANRGHEAVVRLLLATGKVDPDFKNSAGRTLLSQAAADGHEAVVRLLLATGKVDPDSKDSAGRTPLFLAAVRGHEAVVRLLLATGKVDPDSKDSSKYTPLSQAAADGHEAVVRLLLATGKVDPDSKSLVRITPLSEAATYGHKAVVRLLLATGKVDPDSKSSAGETPLFQAATYGHEAVVRLLLATGKVDPDSKTSAGRTPLFLAAVRGHEAVVRLLLATGKVDPDSKDSSKYTPLSQAAADGHEAVVRLLLATGKVDPDSKSLVRITPLSEAATYGHEAVVRLLLATGKVDPDSKNPAGRTPLSLAAAYRHKAVVRLLLATGKVDPDSKDSAGRTLLSQAAADGHEAVVRLLLATGKVDPDSKDSARYTPLSQAANRRHEAVVRLLLATGKVDPDFKNSAGRTLLSQAAADGHEAVVRLLLATDKVDPDSKDSAGRTPLFLAAVRGYEAVVSLLLATGKVDPDSKNPAGRTPLSLAAAYGHEAVVRLLLATGKVDPDSKNSAGRTLLSQAAADRHEAVVVTVLAQLHIWHKSRTLPGSPICTVTCLLRCCHSSGPVAYLAQVTHLAGKSYLHCCLLAPPLPDPLPIRTSPAPPASSLLLFSFPSLSFILYINPSLKSQAKSGQGYWIS